VMARRRRAGSSSLPGPAAFAFFSRVIAITNYLSKLYAERPPSGRRTLPL
jgi:hypothetical protein